GLPQCEGGAHHSEHDKWDCEDGRCAIGHVAIQPGDCDRSLTARARPGHSRGSYAPAPRGRYGVGSTGCPCSRTSKCRWGPVDAPVEPSRPIGCPSVAFSPPVTPPSPPRPANVPKPSPRAP